MPLIEKKYTKEECKAMIRNMTYPVSAPKFVIEAIKRKRREISRSIKSPEKEVDEFMCGLGGTKQDKR